MTDPTLAPACADCPYCAGDMCARFDNLNCQHTAEERHGYPLCSDPSAHDTAQPAPDPLREARAFRAVCATEAKRLADDWNLSGQERNKVVGFVIGLAPRIRAALEAPARPVLDSSSDEQVTSK